MRARLGLNPVIIVVMGCVKADEDSGIPKARGRLHMQSLILGSMENKPEPIGGLAAIAF